ncbi:hypothetical protein L2E82_40470 [Cichorium intybus]|uniref:Uncharacterized protein n=1 Tax=Cichorium intybus TaxID=13427 RepID=A0ACB9AMG0_CICIN|nr:hypothetical protein L2E82_40470 [Cichorium intybus]
MGSVTAFSHFLDSRVRKRKREIKTAVFLEREPNSSGAQHHLFRFPICVFVTEDRRFRVSSTWLNYFIKARFIERLPLSPLYAYNAENFMILEV